MLMRIIGCALLAGIIAGGISALLQQSLVVPLIVEAEIYETAAATTPEATAAAETAHAAAHESGAAHSHGEAASGGLYRTFSTVVMTIGAYVGFAFLLLAGFLVRDARPTLREGLVWGVAGFVALMLAPAAGLAPELPGSGAAPLGARQIWWVATAVSAAAALWLIAFVQAPWAGVLGVVLLALPHLIGAPEAAPASTAPAELGAEFAARSLAVGLAGWVVLGAAAAWAWGRQGALAHQPA